MRRRISPRFWVLIIVVMIVAFGASFALAQHSLREGSIALAEAKQERDALRDEVLDLEAQLEFTQTDEYVIRVARDELDMLMPGEIRYISN